MQFPPPPVTLKAQNRINFEAGAYGNTLQLWDSPEAVADSGYDGLLVSRYNLPGSPYCRYHIEARDAARVWQELIHEGANPKLMYFNEQLRGQTEHMLLQGEFFDGPLGGRHGTPTLYYTTVKALMRDALRQEAHHAFGLEAEMRVRDAMPPSIYADFCAVRELYPGQVIEFTVLDITWGKVPGRNSIIWECRTY